MLRVGCGLYGIGFDWVWAASDPQVFVLTVTSWLIETCSRHTWNDRSAYYS